jgi:hypothetical protein
MFLVMTLKKNFFDRRVRGKLQTIRAIPQQ